MYERTQGTPGAAGGVLPDLRRSGPEIQAGFSTIVLMGTLQSKGMPSLGQWLTEDDVTDILAYIRKRAADEVTAKGG